ncbi:midasin [Paragonimus westermani]|uniref:Midasin n=1 Tax=Paragonimus westermani TaxID=34504 RepID=A0A5J4NT93_9TREM|nr:midasin [Paragonimus westermani]
MAIKRFESILVAGPVGCGKSTFIEQLSETFGVQICHVQVSEQMDAKNLLGTYSCTEIPGQFIWRAGPLLSAMVGGLWLVLEDVDRGSADLQVLLTPLLKSSQSLSSPVLNTTLLDPVTGKPVSRHPDFRILMTRRIVKSHSGDLRLECDNVYADMIERQSCLIMLPAMHNDSLRLVTYILYRRRIELNVNPDEGAVYLGRACLPCHKTAEWETRLAGGVRLNGSPDGTSWPFASTHLACTLLERLAVGISNHEPLLLVGETGTGKTSAVQRLAQLCGRRLHVVNLNQQSDSIDLLGGFKPVDMRTLIRPLREKFETLFCRTFRMETNATFLGHINTCFNDGRWRELFTLMQHPSRLAVTRPETSARPDWLTFLQQLDQLQRRLEAVTKANQPSLGFAFIEGVLVRALQDGDWVLLDEINLAPAEMFDSLSGLLDSERGSLTLVERGDREPLKRSSDFHLFAAMNPSTDVGKRELPVGLRNRFTEIYVPELDPGLDDTDVDLVRAVDREDLATLIRSYLRALNPSPVQITSLVRLYAALRTAALEGLVDGVGQRPHFSRSSRPVLDLLIRRHLCLSFGSQNRKLDLETLNQLIASPLPKPIEKRDASVKNQADYQHVEGYWIPRGPREPRQPAPDTLVDGSYILTPSVRANLKDLARVVAAGGSLPVLLQGETSVGKTSLITYLASRIGQICYRINNHEHTDQQTYLGTYTVASATAQATGKLAEENGTSTPPLVFKDGPLVQAMRLGHWIILDELNLAPTDILEALNRVLDDNRTVFIPDTQEVVRAHSHFRLFATQNPPGLYAGRKMLSRALRNRFIELHFDPIPRDELEIILEKRCALPRSRAHRLVEVMHRLQDPESGRPTGFEHIVWTRDMRRMLVLIGNALKYREPVLLIGDTSCGKTTVCQLFAAIKHQNLHCVNCHQYTEAADFLGGLRPVRRSQSEGDSEPAQDDRLFEWVDGPLVTAMMRGEMFLLDEISLADDAVLECLNSLLEPERRLHLSERFEHAANGVLTPVESDELTAHVDFRLVATMNPGGDYGKKELSPALRNRFTEIWCPSPVIPAAGNCSEPSSLSQCQLSSDLLDIVEHNLSLHLPFLREPYSLMTKQLACVMVDFVVRIADIQLQNRCGGLVGRRTPPTIRDLIAWIRFMQSVTISATGLQPPAPLSTRAISCKPNRSARLDVLSACLHGAALVFLDALDQNTSSIANQGIDDPVADANVHLWKQLGTIASEHRLPTNALDVALHYAHNSSDLAAEGEAVCEQFGLVDDGLWFGADPFYLRTGPLLSTSPDSIAQPFSFSAPTPAMNLRRLLRAMQLPQRALLLEGSPGVGKTTLVLALARACGHEVVRINLSEATEASDLIGCDLPVEGAGAGVFVWRDGPLLQGLRRGHWIVLDEMNLASQSVLECLNACLDHRGEIYIPELGTSFKVNPESTHLFACQNPVREGGGRKGLPKSFLNRFTQLNHRVNVKHEFATEGGPWEFNLRDLMRWSEMILKGQVADLWQEVCSESQITELMAYYKPLGYMRLIGKKQLRVGLAGFDHISNLNVDKLSNYLILDQHRGFAESLLKILEMGWMAILVGPSGSGKRTLVNICSTLVGQPIATMSLSPTADTVELLGTLEQREAGGLFSWVDSPLVTGMRNGHWVVIENAHFCSPSVLDRLNSVLESGGELVLGERGLDPGGRLIRLRPHTAFRLILIVDEAVYGASHSVPNGVSRAMRNRGIEIATLSEVTSAELDFTRLLVSRGTPLPFVRALITFHSIYASVCAGLSSGTTHQSNFLIESVFTALRPGCCKRPPVGMLLSAGLVVNQLLDTSPDTGMFIPTIRPLSHDDTDASDEQTDSINYDPNGSQTHWCWILYRTLNLVYTMRQPNHQAARLTNQLVRRFIRDIWENRPEIRQSLEQLDYADPTAIVLHHLSELVQCGTADGYRRHHARLVCMAARSCPTDQSLYRRIFLEQANLDDLSHLPDQLTQAIQRIDKTVVDSLGWPSTWVSEDWSDWPDLRWFPGWRYLTTDSSRLSVHKWDIYFRSLLIDELVQFVASSCVTSNEVPEKLNQVEQLSVIQAVCQLRRGHLSAACLDNFPGLNTVLDPWLDFVRSFMFAKAGESTQADWLTCCRAISLIWTWFSHFALKPLFVEAIDWSDRLTYYTERAQMCDLEERRVRPPCFEIMRPHFPLSIQPLFFSCSIESPLIVPNWILFGKKLGDILVTLRSDCSSNDLDEDEDVQDEEMTELLYTNTQISDERASATDLSTKTPQVRNMCLWPLAMLSVLRLDRCVVSRDPAAGSIRARVRIFLLGLTRPRILTILSMLQPTFMSSRAQQRAFQRCLTETAVDRWVQDVCCQIDLLATGRLASAFTVDQLERPTLSGEWRSLSQATFALTWPTLSRYSEGTCSTDQPLIGWLHSRIVFGYAHRLLLLCSMWTPQYEITSSPGSNQRERPADVKDLFRESAALLHAVHSVLVSFLHPEHIQPNTSGQPFHVDDFMQWILTSFTPTVDQAKLAFRVSQEWMELLYLIEGFISCLIQLSHQPTPPSLLAVGWIIFGCVHVRSVCPHGPLDPWLVEQLELEASSSELQRVDRELVLRQKIRNLTFGHPECALPISTSSEPAEWMNTALNLRNLANAGLEHPWVAALMTYREQLASKVSDLSERAAKNRSLVPMKRQISNLQSSAVLELVELLSTGLLTNKRITERKISTSCPSSALSLATQLTSVAWRNILKQSVSRDLLSDSSQANRNAQFRVEFRLFSLVLDLIWLHRLESCAYSNNIQFIGRLLAFLNRPLAWCWQQAEAERKKLAAERAALFIEATGRKQRLQYELQQLPKRPKQRLADENSDLVDPDLMEEVEWRLRFPETASLQAVVELATDRRSFGLAKEEQIQQTVDRMQAVDAWLAEALRKTNQTWVPDDCELSYWVERTLGLLLADANCTDLGQSTIEWRWHVLLGGYSLAGWLACHHDNLSLDPAIDVPSLPVHIATTAYLSQADLRARVSLHDRTRPFRHVLDVYRDPISLDAALQLQTVMERLDSRVRQLLHDWPGQPSLIREWEKNAGKHVSLMEHCKAVCDLLIEWRKTELKCWLSTLDTAERTLANRALTLWFHLHDVFLTRPSASNQSPPDVSHCEVLVQLMENGPLAEFTTRWRLLAGLRVALDIWPGLDEQARSSAQRIVGNVIWFYAQFVPHVQQELVNLRRPIEKELKVRNWEAVLRRPVRPLFEAAIAVPRLESLSSLAALDVRLPSTTLISNSENRWPLVDDLQWLCAEQAQRHSLPNLLRRLPTLLTRFRRHLERLRTKAPVAKWTQCLLTGMRTWIQLVSELENSTRHLESTCPPAHRLRQLHATETKSTTRNPEPNDLDEVRKWHQQFTALQQQKRLVLAQWLKVASARSQPRGYASQEGNQFEASLDLDESRLSTFEESLAEAEEEKEEDSAEMISFDGGTLPQLGLSYRRGQRHTQTGFMTEFLVHIQGDPWMQVNSHVLQTVHEGLGSTAKS